VLGRDESSSGPEIDVAGRGSPAQTAFDTSELGRLDAVETAARVRAGELAHEDVVAAAIERARSLEPALNAISTETYDTASSQARERRVGRFSGVPTFVKGIDDLAGVVNDHGSRAYRSHVPKRTEPFVDALLATGLISLGKSSAPESGLTGTTEPLAHGPTRNPWNLSHSPGGSSGGAAALVAARVVPLAHGSDGAGSIRIPSSFCGLVGLKPSRERLFAPTVGERLPLRILSFGALTRSVRDTAHFAAALEERIPSRKLPPIGLVEGPAKQRLRIGLFTDSPLGTPVHPDTREAVIAAGRACADLGHAVEEIPCPFPGRVLEDFWLYWTFLGWGFVAQTRWMKKRRYDPGQLEPWTHGLSDRFTAQLRKALPALLRLRGVHRISARVFADTDLLMCPTTAAPAPEIGYLGPEVAFETAFERVTSCFCFTPIQNAAGDPAISLPLGLSADGLPVGVQFAAVPGGEATLLALAYELEAAGAFRSPTP